jgi:signal transduction histidine kinase
MAPTPTIAQGLAPRSREILDAWAAEAQRAASARGLTKPALMNIMPKLLAAILRPGEEPARREAQAELAHSHLASRLRAGYSLEESLDEISILSRVLVRIWRTLPEEERVDTAGLDRLLGDLHAVSITLARAFDEYLHEDEQTEKRYLRLLYEPFTDLRDGTPPLCQKRLLGALAVVMEATGADTAALLLHDAKTGDLVMSASVGTVAEPFSGYVRKVDESSFVGKVASDEQPTVMRDVESTTLEVPDELRHSGIHAVLGVRLPAQRALLGVLYIGVRAQRVFGHREVRRIEALGEGLSLHLDNAKLYAELIGQNEALRAERRLRSQFVAILAHDLRGPLAAARLAAGLLAARDPAPPRAERRNVDRVVRNLDATDRMVTDLLDAETIHAGHRLPATLAAHSLAEIARAVVSELDAGHPSRVALRTEGGTTGLCDAALVRRAVWNMLTNAVKYGSREAPIEVSVRGCEGAVEVAVHNDGAPIPEAEQAGLFDPFSRVATPRGAHGWGLGLALVRGTAEAHGGSVRLESAPGRGTTFTLRIPRGAASRAA